MFSTAPTKLVINNRYELANLLGEGGMGVVYRAFDHLTADEVALKRVHNLPMGGTESSSGLRVALAQEFRTLASVRHPHVISVLDYGFDSNRQPFFTMELLKGAQNILRAAQHRPFEGKVALLLQMLQALVYLHRRGIIHRDLKPDNVLVIGDQVKVVDFGLATLQARQRDTQQDSLHGTLTYMAPEVLNGDPATEAADIFAAGIIAYEVFAGVHPFQAPTITKLIENIQFFQPDLNALEVPAGVRDLLRRMLAKPVSDRYHDSATLVTALSELIGEGSKPEAVPIRESFLQAADFIGREAELAQLTEAFGQAVQGSGSAWLIGGESGVGKSRLLDEVQVQAMVSGALVLRGQPEAQGGAPYAIWRDVLRRLIIATPLSDLEAGVIKPIVPDIGRLLDREVPDAPDIDADAALIRLQNTVEAIFRRQKQPTVLLLEDLQWAAESLPLLKRLSHIVSGLPLLIIANYRDDERPDLAAELASMRLIKLPRLSKDEVARLSMSMLGGADREASEKLVGMLHKQTEGNALFIVEVVRALAEDAGRLDSVWNLTPRSNLFPGGMRAVVERRLNRVPEEARALLDLAAVAGRALDLKLLAAAAPGLNVDAWLPIVATVIDVSDNTYRFAHDKLREGLLERLNDAQKAALHVQIAEALQAVYGDDPTQAVALAYHWSEAANRPEASAFVLRQAIDALERAARQMMAQNAFAQVVATINGLLAFHARHVALDPGAAASAERQANWYNDLGRATGLVGNYEQGYQLLLHAGDLYGYPLPRTKLGKTAALLRQIGVQAAHRLAPRRFVRAVPDARADLLHEVSELYSYLGIVAYVIHENQISLFTNLRALNVMESSGMKGELPGLYALMCNLAGTLGLTRLADTYYALIERFPAVYMTPNVAGYAYSVAGLYYTSAGQYDLAADLLKRSIESLNQVGNTSGMLIALTTLASARFYQGDLAGAEAHYEEAIRHSRDSAIYTSLVPALCLRAFSIDLTRGQLEAAESKLAEARALLRDNPTLYSGYHLYAWANSALTALHQGRTSEALAAADKALEVAEASQHTANLGFYPLAAVAEVYLSLAEAGQAETLGITRERLLTRAGLAAKRLGRLTPVVGKPRLGRVRGWLHWLKGDVAGARKAWEKGLAAAHVAQMPFEEGILHHDLGRHLPPGDPARRSHLEAASARFEQVGATWWIERTAAARETTAS